MANSWSLYNLYYPGGYGGFWRQPVPGGLVYPQQPTGNFDLLSQVPFSEKTGQYNGSCGHSFNLVKVERDRDVTTGRSVALLCCPSCSTVQRTISPYEDALAGGLENAILYP
jgi:hypothetical protein